MRQIERVLFVRTDRMGDLLMNFPAIHLLRQTYPKAWLTVMVDRTVSDLVVNHPDIDEVLAIDSETTLKKWGVLLRLSKRLKKAEYQLAVVSNPHKFLHAASFLAGIPHRVGYDKKWGFLLTKRMTAPSTPSRHEIDRNLELASLASDKAWDGAVVMALDTDSKQRVEARFAAEAPEAKRVVAVHPGTSNPVKRWGSDRFAEVVQKLPEDVLPVLVGGQEETQTSASVAAACGRKILDWTGKLPLKQLVAFFSDPRVHALVSSDSGPVHVAWMAGTPAVALYAADSPGSDPARWGPRDGKSRMIHKPMAAITAEEVSRELEALLEAGKKRL